MSSGSDHPEDREPSGLAGLYALDALEGEELERFERYLDENPAAREEVAGFRETASHLATMSARPAPEGMRARVLGQLGDVRQEPVSLDAARARRRQSPARWVATVAAAALLVVAGGIGGYLVADRDSTELAGPETELAEVLANDDAAVARLEGDGTMSARLVYSSSGGRAVLVSDGLAAPPEGRTYQMWRVRGEEPVDAGLLEAGADGVVGNAVDMEFTSGDVVAVTVEPEGGSPAPTTPILLSAEI